MPDGVVVGGWGYVISAYSITTVVLLGYTWSLWRRQRAENQRSREDE